MLQYPIISRLNSMFYVKKLVKVGKNFNFGEDDKNA